MAFYETTIENYFNTINALSQNTPTNPYNVIITDIENLRMVSDTQSNLTREINTAQRYVNIKWYVEFFDTLQPLNINDASYLFYNCHYLTRIDISPFRNANCIDYLLGNCENLIEIDLTDYRKIFASNVKYGFDNSDGEYTDSENNTYSSSLTVFSGCTSLQYAYVKNAITSQQIINSLPNDTQCVKSSAWIMLTPVIIDDDESVIIDDDEFTYEYDSLSSNIINVLNKFPVNTPETPYRIYLDLETDKIGRDRYMNSDSISDFIKTAGRYVDLFINPLGFYTDTKFDTYNKSFKNNEYLVGIEFNTSLIPKDASASYNFYQLFKGCIHLRNVRGFLEFLNTNTNQVQASNWASISLQETFFGCVSIKNVTFHTGRLGNLTVQSCFAYCVNLEKADISFSNIPRLVITDIFKGCDSLTELSFYEDCGRSNLYVYDNFLQFNSSIRKLKLSIKETNFQNILANLPNLIYLDVSDNTDLTYLDISRLSELEYYEYQRIGDEKVQTNGWYARNCPNLTELKLLYKQAVEANNNANNRTEPLRGTNVSTVIIFSNEARELKGKELHYSEASFENKVRIKDEIFFKNPYIDGQLFNGINNVNHFAVCDRIVDLWRFPLYLSNFRLESGARISVLFPYGCSDSSFAIYGSLTNRFDGLAFEVTGDNNTDGEIYPIKMGGEGVWYGFVSPGEIIEMVFCEEDKSFHCLTGNTIYEGVFREYLNVHIFDIPCFRKLRGGMIEQWGKVDMSSNVKNLGNNIFEIDLKIPFSNTDYLINLTPEVSGTLSSNLAIIKNDEYSQQIDKFFVKNTSNCNFHFYARGY